MSSLKRTQCGCGLTTTMRSRKVCYDDYNSKFWVESRLEALERQCAARMPDIAVLNKYQDNRYSVMERQLEAERRRFYRKNLVVFNKHKQNLIDHVAYKRVLFQKTLENNRAKSESNIHNQFNCLGICRLDVQSQIEEKRKDFCPTFRRLNAAKKLLEAQRQPKVQEPPKEHESPVGKVRRIKRRESFYLIGPSPNRHCSCILSTYC
ncbi:uncharacterized protein LOC121369242 [Gigantopelta aegis]|uniref:uncharacterized protein LOC121369242 n=1 Tax=Gigantopelta aegis TaxID=1735272 RepID=UPI001B88A5BD|nr:uncharacterized protein LOC121369242 [Gigantopelta aegis]